MGTVPAQSRAGKPQSTPSVAPGPGGPPSGTPGPGGPPSEPSPPATHKRSRRKSFLAPVILFLLGLLLFFLAFELYPRATEGPAPAFPHLYVFTRGHVEKIDFMVTQMGPKYTGIDVTVTLDPNFPVNGTYVILGIDPPQGATRVGCVPTCGLSGLQTLQFTTSEYVHSLVIVQASSLGINADSVTAKVAIPEVIYQGAGTPPILFVWYHLNSVTNYDWSSYPTYSVSNSVTEWEEALVQGDTIGRTAVGINHAGQAERDTMTFIAGALVALAGGALLGAFQEVLTARK